MQSHSPWSPNDQQHPECPLFPKAVIQTSENGIKFRSAFGHKRPVAGHDLNGGSRPASLTFALTGRARQRAKVLPCRATRCAVTGATSYSSCLSPSPRNGRGRRLRTPPSTPWPRRKWLVVSLDSLRRPTATRDGHQHSNRGESILAPCT